MKKNLSLIQKERYIGTRNLIIVIQNFEEKTNKKLQTHTQIHDTLIYSQVQSPRTGHTQYLYEYMLYLHVLIKHTHTHNINTITHINTHTHTNTLTKRYQSQCVIRGFLIVDIEPLNVAGYYSNFELFMGKNQRISKVQMRNLVLLII